MVCVCVYNAMLLPLCVNVQKLSILNLAMYPNPPAIEDDKTHHNDTHTKFMYLPIVVTVCGWYDAMYLLDCLIYIICRLK